MRNKPFQNYPDDADYNTNAPSYYDDLARKQKLIQLLAEKVWEYDERLDNRIADLEEVLSRYLSQWDERIENLDDEVSDIFIEWLNDGTLEQIINHDVLGNKADKVELDKTNIQLAQTARIVIPQMFGAIGDGIADDYQSLVDTFNYAMDNEYTVDLLNGYTYLINTNITNLVGHDRTFFEITNKIIITGTSTIKVGQVGDYEAVFRLRDNSGGSEFHNFTIDENTLYNHTTENEVSHLNDHVGKRRITFYGFNNTDIENLYFKNVKINDCIGVWQIQARANNVTIDNIIVNYAKNNNGINPKYDRTCIYMAGNNWNVLNSEFYGSLLANTAIETHGANQTIDNVKVVDFTAMFFIVNDRQGMINGSIENINIINSYFNCRSGGVIMVYL